MQSGRSLRTREAPALVPACAHSRAEAAQQQFGGMWKGTPFLGAWGGCPGASRSHLVWRLHVILWSSERDPILGLGNLKLRP